jgi:hypothetical protein
VTQLRQRMLHEIQRRNYSPSTIRTYLGAVQQFAEHFHCSPEQLGPEHLRRYQVFLLQEKKLEPSTVEIRISTLRFLYKRVREATSSRRKKDCDRAQLFSSRLDRCIRACRGGGPDLLFGGTLTINGNRTEDFPCPLPHCGWVGHVSRERNPTSEIGKQCEPDVKGLPRAVDIASVSFCPFAKRAAPSLPV